MEVNRLRNEIRMGQDRLVNELEENNSLRTRIRDLEDILRLLNPNSDIDTDSEFDTTASSQEGNDIIDIEAIESDNEVEQ
eukprot:14771932-Heterocapsa_arctica.AAC.1